MSLRDMLDTEEGRALLVRADAAPFLRGSLRTTPEDDGFVRPWRFTAGQVRVLGSVAAWHPGLYRQMARCTAGVRLEFETDSSEIGVEVQMDPEPSGTREVLVALDGDAPRAHDGLSCDVDGRHLDVRMPPVGRSVVAFYLDEDTEHPGWHLQRLPGLGPTRRVVVWLPCLRGCSVRAVWGDGTRIDAVRTDGAGTLLLLGDSLSQGFVSEDPALSWPALLARELGLDLVNQSVGGQVVQPDTLLGLRGMEAPAQVVVEFGANYRYEPYPTERLARDAHAYLDGLARLWPHVPLWVMTLPWDGGATACQGSCYAAVDKVWRDEVARRPDARLLEGPRLMDHEGILTVDGDCHPGKEGNAQIARRVLLMMEDSLAKGTPAGEGPSEASSEATSSVGGEPADPVRDRARRLLQSSRDRRAFPLAEAARRGIGRWLYADTSCALAVFPSGMQSFYAADARHGGDVLAVHGTTGALSLAAPDLAPVAQGCLGLDAPEPYHLAIYRGKRRIKVPARYHVETLDATWLDAVYDACHELHYYTRDQMARKLAHGDMLGGIDQDGKLVGIMGLHDDGSMGMLEVLPPYRRHRWAMALECTLINRCLKQGWTPWCTVYPENRASLDLQRKLGLELTPADEQCYLPRHGAREGR